ncbi:hypothetical protein [uncultured Nitratireductor sp.]|uniref:hypothetical protein n=1 Tax=uncultured Nitratireductor sp. TaxID=520953 RepID=UPI0025D2D418|nr:hypothetical protein [uncultured Nitratireductor sp.]
MGAGRNTIFRHGRVAAMTLAGLFITLTTAFAAGGACDGVKVEMTKARKDRYAPLVVSAMEAKIKPAQVEFSAILENGNWSATYVSTPASDDGMMFFHTVNGKMHFREVWGGWAEPSERPELVAWARKLGAPVALATCFAETVTEGE